ncbi:hypothetical protein DAEQUDRAFT_766764 [Daedalea quercina L-15889]|uniref:Uncharacterized protein n=1 Tax=Daedalea quercina L-15889 TaxID=1314783 RepID=A0A165P603_9APHY|nr:hypothetical protein DAEQUDRAFT_766764 [Daedalea quercina L-15889]
MQNSAGVGHGRGGVDGHLSRSGGLPRSRKKPPPIVPAHTHTQWPQAPVVSVPDMLPILFGGLQPSPPKEESKDTKVHWDGSAESSAAVDRDRKQAVLNKEWCGAAEGKTAKEQTNTPIE